jgi:MFS family permease
MPREFALPTSLRLELDAQRMHAPKVPASPDSSVLAAALASLPAVFDLSASVIVAVLVFPNMFFPGLSPVVGALASLSVCGLSVAAGYVAAPVWAVIRRRHGLGVTLTAAYFLLGAAMASAAFLPGRATVGLAALGMLAASRLAMGLALGGTRQGRRRGGDRAKTGLGVLLGIALTVALFTALAESLQPPDFVAWGWRYPFMMGPALNIVALFARLRLVAAGPAGWPGDRGGPRLTSLTVSPHGRPTGR